MLCNSFYRTDSALKFGWFFLSYLVCLFLFLLCLFPLGIHAANPLFTPLFRYTLAFASLLLLLLQLFSRGSLLRKFYLTSYFKGFCLLITIILLLVRNGTTVVVLYYHFSLDCIFFNVLKLSIVMLLL